MSKLALFDFDGTITNSDTLFKFIRFYVGDTKFIFGMFLLSPMLLIYKLGFIPNSRAKEYLLSYFFKNIQSSIFKERAREFSLKEIDKILRSGAITKILWHKEKGDDIVIVSASIKCWLKPWCEKYNIKLISTELEIKEDKLTGKFSTKNCHGAEKVHRIKVECNLDLYEYIYAYGDSSGDTEMLTLADESFYKPFRDLK